MPPSQPKISVSKYWKTVVLSERDGNQGTSSPTGAGTLVVSFTYTNAA